ncbi:MAG: glycosyltransferase family 2 protein [Campylobacterales bacterium]|nr:glycosyltransferase family 2 protein [Campylobacterales bacterium]
MRISSSIVLYRESSATLERVLASFASIEGEKELIVLDNSPTPALQTLCLRYGAAYLHEPRNIGFGAGHNRAFGARTQPSDVHLLINPDTRFEGAAVLEFARWLHRQNDIALATPALINPDGTPQHFIRPIPTPFSLIKRRLFGHQKSKMEEYEEIAAIPFAHGSFLGLRSEIFARLGGFDERFFLYMEDVDLFIRAKALGQTVIYPHCTITHEHRRGSSKSLKLLLIHLRSAFKFFWKYRTSEPMLQ